MPKSLPTKRLESLPKNAKRVFNGVIFDVYHWKQKMYDGSTATFEKIVRPDTVEALATVGKKIIILDQQQPNLTQEKVTLPGGRADQHHNPLVEAQRELLEETGFISSDWQLLHTESPPDSKVMYSMHYFIARNCKKVAKSRLDVGEKIKSRLVSLEQLLRLSDSPRFWVGPWFLQELLRMRLDPKRKEKFRRLLFPGALADHDG
ncbi:MAG: NUDIX hydrolase [Candidatus Liptonbacteria bacterium]|nr:NUDIX hydrolase [Candidatus Liptonbacteria bacterium]